MRNLPIQSLAMGLSLVLLVPFSAADAATSPRNYQQNGGSACTGSTPAHEGSLRKRPKAIANEGTTTAYITCSALSDQTGPKPTAVLAWFTNRSAVAVTVSCTMVDGDEFNGSTAFPASKVFAPGLFDGMLWTPPGPTFRAAVSLSCALPPGVELNFFSHAAQEEIGT